MKDTEINLAVFSEVSLFDNITPIQNVVTQKIRVNSEMNLGRWVKYYRNKCSTRNTSFVHDKKQLFSCDHEMKLCKASPNKQFEMDSR